MAQIVDQVEHLAIRQLGVGDPEIESGGVEFLAQRRDRLEILEDAKAHAVQHGPHRTIEDRRRFRQQHAHPVKPVDVE